MPYLINNQTRPYDFGTDAIERQRVSLGQSLIDADFEYGLQATKWQTHQDVSRSPSFYEIAGTDLIITAINSGGQTPSIITVNTSSVSPAVGTVISITGLTTPQAEGFYIVATSGAGTFTYIAKGLVAITAGSIFTSYITIRRGGIYNSGACKLQVSSVIQSGTVVTVTTSTAHGLIAGSGILAYGWLITTAFNGSWFIESVTGTNTFTVVVATTTNGTGTTGSIYLQPYSFCVHRPYDGGVLISIGSPSYGASIVRQSKKVFRYQSGKGMLWSSGTLFCPNNDITSITSSGTTIGSIITITTSIPHGGPQAGSTIIIRGIVTSGYNNTYVVASIVNAFTLTVVAIATLGSTVVTESFQPRFIISRWHGGSIRAGTFDEQNGIFWEYDGSNLWVVRRSSTFQISGNISISGANSQTLTGDANTRFRDQFRVSDGFVIRGMTYYVTGITAQNTLTFNPPYRGTVAVSNTPCCRIMESRVPQSAFNRDTLDGTGPSGYNVDLTRMQMIGIQWTWYGAGFVDFMMRGVNGNWTMAHRISNNNVNDEAYMRTGNMPVRYEISNTLSSAISQLTSGIAASGSDPILLNDPTGYWPVSGTVMIDQELISYTSRSTSTIAPGSISGITRAVNLAYSISNLPSRNFSGTPATSHTASTTVAVVSCTCSPSLTHWGSALLMDGQFDNDRGYFFNYLFNGTIIMSGTSSTAYFLRLSPSVSNSVTGDIGTRELLTRAQLLLSKMDVLMYGGTNSYMNVQGILNPIGLTPTNFVSVSTQGTGGQPSFTQISTTSTGVYTAGSGERIFSIIAPSGAVNTVDLTSLKELASTIIGGNSIFPDGPDTLMIFVTQYNAPSSSFAINLYWSEAQA